MTLVVDASLATKWLIEEEDSRSAERFFERFFGQMHCPDTLMVELMGTLVRRANQRTTTSAEAMDGAERLKTWLGDAVVLHRITPELMIAATAIALALGHPIKDCIYLALADQLGCP